VSVSVVDVSQVTPFKSEPTIEIIFYLKSFRKNWQGLTFQLKEEFGWREFA